MVGNELSGPIPGQDDYIEPCFAKRSRFLQHSQDWITRVVEDPQQAKTLSRVAATFTEDYLEGRIQRRTATRQGCRACE
jgi:CHASE3 domain sensor protein